MFDTYEEAYADAQATADRLGMEIGLWKPEGPLGLWCTAILPWPENRRGSELRCQVVRPAKYREGYPEGW